MTKVFHKIYSVTFNILRINYGLILPGMILILLLILRINSGKYSLDTAHTIDVLQNFMSNGSLYSNIAGTHRFNLHFSPIYIILAPLSLLPTTIFLFLWKFICFGSFVYFIIRIVTEQQLLNNFQKNIFIMVACFHPTFFLGVLDPNIWDTELALPFIGLSLLALARKKYFLSIIYFTVTYAVKEDMPLVGIMYGIVLTIESKRRIFLLYSVFSLIMFLLVTQIIMPSFSIAGNSIELLSQNYGYLGETFTDIIFNIITEQTTLTESGYWLRKTVTIIILALSVAFLPFTSFRSALYLLPTLPIFGYALISNEPFLDYSKHYVLVIYSFTVIGALYGYSTNRSKLVAIAACLSVIASVAIIMLHIILRNWLFYFTPIDNFRSVEEALAQVPRSELILTHGVSSPWIGHNRSFQLSDDFSNLDLSDEKVKFVLINKQTVFWEVLTDHKNIELKQNLRNMNQSLEFLDVYNFSNVILLKKTIHNTVKTSQGDWSSDLERFEGVNQVKGKLSLVNKFKKM